jgi:hypothetical protein
MIIADASFWLALANRSDRHHHAAVRSLDLVREPLVTTWPVLTETCHLLSNRLGVAAQLTFVRSAQDGAFEIFDLTRHHWPRIETLMTKYKDLPMDLADASVVLLAEDLGTGRILTTDRRDFGAYRWKSRKPFQNLMDDQGW